VKEDLNRQVAELERQVLGQLCSAPGKKGIWQSSLWRDVGVKQLELESNGKQFDCLLLVNEGRLEVNIQETAGQRRVWQTNLGRTRGGMIIDNDALMHIPFRASDGSGEQRPLDLAEKITFLKQLSEAEIINDSYAEEVGEILLLRD